MLEFEGLNYWAIVIAWLVYVVVGAFWYSPAGFGKPWSTLSGVDIMKIPEKEATRIIISVAVSAAVQAFVLGLVIHSLAITDVWVGIATAIAVWLGFVAATSVGVTLYQRKSWKFWWLNNSYFLIVMIVAALIFTAWK